MNNSENMQQICSSLKTLGYISVSDKMLDAYKNGSDNPVALIRLALDTAVTDTRNAKYDKCLRLSKLGNPVFFQDLLTYDVRQLDLEYLNNLRRLDFVREGSNLIIWGAPGTGKTWMNKAIATKACQEGIRTRWVTYPYLCRELMRLKIEDSQKFETRIKYYSKYDLLCIDEFPNYNIEDKYLMQEFFNQIKTANHSVVISGQCSPENWDSLFEVKSFGQSIRGRLLEKAHRLELKGPDLRTYVPNKE